MDECKLTTDIENLVGLIQHLSNDELKELINDDNKVEDLINSSTENFKWLQRKKETVMVENKSIAEYNLSMGSKLEEGKTKLKDLNKVGVTLSNNVKQKMNSFRNKGNKSSTETVLALLQTAAVEAEEESENIAEKFFQKEIDVDNFITNFELARNLMHLRRVKADKMSDLIKQSTNNYNYDRNHSHVPSRPAPPAPTTGFTPYPVGPISMMPYPMPMNHH